VKIIGITGGIASGKSTAARMLCNTGVLHVDADAIVHRLMARDRAVIAAIAAAFPFAVADGNILRSALAAHIAAQPAALMVLEHILHPRVREEEARAIALAKKQRRRGVLLDVPLLFETGLDAWCDAVVVIGVSPSIQRQRALRRPAMSEDKLQRLLARQTKEAERRNAADVVVMSTLGKAHMRRALEKLKHQWGWA
jgi:dephospho-CoA kinase